MSLKAKLSKKRKSKEEKRKNSREKVSQESCNNKVKLMIQMMKKKNKRQFRLKHLNNQQQIIFVQPFS